MNKIGYLIILAAVIFLTSCSGTKNIPEGSYLLKKTKLEVNTVENIDKDVMSTYLKQKPNRKILWIYPFHLNVYQLMSKGKPRKFKEKFKEVIGEEPVIFDPVLHEKTMSNLQWYLENKGYYHAKISDKIDTSKKTVKLTYKIESGEIFRIANLEFVNNDSLISPAVLAKIKQNSLLQKNAPFDIDLLEAERTRINQIMRNSGYYAFSRDYIEYMADTNQNASQVKLQIILNKPVKETQHFLYQIKDLVVYLNVGVNDLTNAKTLIINGKKLIYSGDIPVLKPELILSSIRIQPGSFFKAGSQDDTYRRLNDLQQFRLVNVQYLPAGIDSVTDIPQLVCQISLGTGNSQAYQVSFEGTNSSNHWGIGGNLSYSHKNLYRGAELLNIKLRGAFEYQLNNTSEKVSFLAPNILDYGLEASIHFPEFWTPWESLKLADKFFPKTRISAQFGHQKKPYYTRRLLNSGFGYTWRSNDRSLHFMNPIELDIINLTDTTAEFNQIFDTLYMRYSYESQFISASNYTWQYSSQDKKKRKDFIYANIRAEVAGNILAGFNQLIGRQKTEEGFYELFSTRFAQYVKSDIDLRYYHYFGNSSILAYRGFAGLALPYGNNMVLPFVKKYFIGGPNSIRAWQVRSLGPGTYVDNSFFPDLSADIKLEANIEYRFDVVWRLKGAVFVDMGNIWAINTYDERDGALFRFDSFYKQIAVGTGIGARFDFDFILFRIDLGLKMVDPELPEGKRWLYTHRGIKTSDLNWNFGIDYPF